MISRRLLRIKILQVLFAYFRNESNSLNNVEKELFLSIEKSYQLYHLLLILPEALSNTAHSKIELAKQKLRPSKEDLNPNTRFVDNKVIKQIDENEDISLYVAQNRLNWKHHPELVKILFKQLTNSNYYKEYMTAPENSYNDDKQVIISFLQHELESSDEFSNFLEELSIYWNDDLEFVLSMAAKTIKKADEETGIKVMPMFRNEDDVDFSKRLLRKAVLKHGEYVTLVEKFTKNWDVDRIAAMDILIMEMAISEIVEFPTIPVKVTLNEYIEIAKFYSTDQSSTFINGVLDKLIAYMRENNLFMKQGRGLIGDNEQLIDINSDED